MQSLLVIHSKACFPQWPGLKDMERKFIAQRITILYIICFFPYPQLFAQTDTARPWGNWKTWGDQGNGTYVNPVLPADYSDLDCIRVGDDYYAISSTFHYAPGMVVLHSKDLVNWRILSHVVNNLNEISPQMNWDKMDRYGRGIWAGAIRYACIV
jgi:hypothetical protein